GGRAGFARVVVYDPANQAHVYAGTGNAGYKSTNGASSWTRFSNGLTNTNVVALAIDPVNPGTLYVGTANAGFFKTIDGAATWTTIGPPDPSAPIISAIAIDNSNTSTFFLATEGAGIFKSTDGGATSVAVNTNLTTLDVRAL